MKLFLDQKQLSGNKQCKVSTHQFSKIKPGNSVIYLRVSQLLEADGYSRRRLPDGGTRYKVRLVAQGFSQIKGINYEETYSPVVRFTSLRLLFAYAARKSLDVYHLDVETAFLHGDMNETVYLQQPQGFVPKGQENKVCLLKKAIYGLKQ